MISDASALAVQQNGKILLGGDAYHTGSVFNFALARYLPSGLLDSGFGPSMNGTVTTPIGSTAFGSALALQSDGRIVFAGSADTPSQAIAVARYLGDPTAKAMIDFATIPTTGGSITLNGTTYQNGQSGNYTTGTVTISASPTAGYTFSSWSSMGGISVTSPTSNPTTAMITGSGTLIAVFTKAASAIYPGSIVLGAVITTVLIRLVRSKRKIA